MKDHAIKSRGNRYTAGDTFALDVEIERNYKTLIYSA
jgi:hypothetical protein